MSKIKKTGIEHLEQNHINWFPGHMNKAIKEIKKKIKAVNLVIEVRDARAPLASGNKANYADSVGQALFDRTEQGKSRGPQGIGAMERPTSKKRKSPIFLLMLWIKTPLKT